MNIYKELYEYLKSADVEAQNRAFNTPVKISNTCRGRKKYTRPDGSWTWIYPSKTLD